MKALLVAAIVILFLSCPANAPSNLTFARIMDPADFPLTGYAVVNPTASQATVTFTLYDATGTVKGVSTLSVAAGGQLAKVGSELFPGAAVTGWVQAASATSNLRGFWLS